MSAWMKQIASQVKKHGEKKASWYCFWYEPDGTRRKKSCGIGEAGKSAAKKLVKQRKAELLLGTYKREDKKTWDDFVKSYKERVLSGLSPSGAYAATISLQHFKRIIKPKLVSGITSDRIAEFVAKRRTERGVKANSKITPATINKDLRHLRATLRTAFDWGLLDRVPKFKFEKEPKKLPKYVPPEDFAAIYKASAAALNPTGLPYASEDWWKGLLTMAFLTGWRIGELLSLKWDDVDLESGTAITRHGDNKGNRTEKVSLHPTVVDHLKNLRNFDERVFPWDLSRRRLYCDFALIQDKAGIKLDCPDLGNPNHGECTDACRRYGFHDERRAFATLNAEHMTREALQSLMRHQSSSTTDRYINNARQLNPAVEKIYVPEILRSNKASDGA